MLPPSLANKRELVIHLCSHCLVEQDWGFLVGKECNVANRLAIVNRGRIADWEYCSGGDVRRLFECAERVDAEAFFDVCRNDLRAVGGVQDKRKDLVLYESEQFVIRGILNEAGAGRRQRVDGAVVGYVEMEFEAVVWRLYENELAVPADARSCRVRARLVANCEGSALVGCGSQLFVKARPGRERSAHGLTVESNVENASYPCAGLERSKMLSEKIGFRSLGSSALRNSAISTALQRT